MNSILNKDKLDFYQNTRYEILTPDGWKDFSGIVKYDKKKLLRITTKNNKSVVVSHNHLLCFGDEEIMAKDSLGKLVDTEDGESEIVEIVEADEDYVYDVSDVSDNNKFYSNGIVSHNTHIMDPFWSSVFPIVSSSKKSKVFMCSTANGTGNLFHSIYTDSIEGKNGWANDKILWNEVPGRTEKWARETKSGLASDEKWSQEYECNFLNSGTSSINEYLYNELKKQLREPIEILMDGKYKIWEHPNPERMYVVGVDVGEGVGGDYSVIKVLDITDLREIVEVAEYYDNMIPVAEFSNKLHEILQHWGNPLVCIERNNQGGQVADRLGFDFGYPKMVNWGSKLGGRKNLELFGMVSSRNTKYYACSNARYYYSDKGAVVFRNDQSLEEIFKDFVKVNDTWQASSGKHDDRTMATIWALMVLDKELCERWFTIDEFDDCGKPLRLSPLDFGIQYFENPTSIYTNEQVDRIEHSRLAPMVFGSFGEADNEISQLENDGWSLLGGGSMPYIDPSRTFNDSQWDSYNRLF